MTLIKSPSSTVELPSKSAWAIITCSSSSIKRTLNFCVASRSLFKVMTEGSLSSMPLSAWKIALTSSSGSTMVDSPLISAVNSSRETLSEPSASIVSNLSWCCSLLCLPESESRKPSAVIATSNSLRSIEPSPSVSNRSKISLIWSIWRCVSVIWLDDCLVDLITGLRWDLASKYWDKCLARRVQ